MTRTQIEKRLEKLKEKTQTLADEWRELYDDMQNYFDNQSDEWQIGKNGNTYYDYMDGILEQVSSLNEAANFKLN